MAQHKKEIEALTQKYNKNIINLKMNLPSPYSPETHTILIDKRYAKYDLKWYLLTVLTEKDKNYENTFWVSDFDMKPLLEQFNKFKTEKELEDEKFDNLYKMQEKWLKQLDGKEENKKPRKKREKKERKEKITKTKGKERKKNKVKGKKKLNNKKNNNKNKKERKKRKEKKKEENERKEENKEKEGNDKMEEEQKEKEEKDE